MTEEMIHVHDVLDLIAATESRFTVEGLITKLKHTYGEEALFTNCSRIPLTVYHVIPFLQSRGKIALEGENVVPLFGPGRCEH